MLKQKWHIHQTVYAEIIGIYTHAGTNNPVEKQLNIICTALCKGKLGDKNTRHAITNLPPIDICNLTSPNPISLKYKDYGAKHSLLSAITQFAHYNYFLTDKMVCKRIKCCLYQRSVFNNTNSNW